MIPPQKSDWKWPVGAPRGEERRGRTPFIREIPYEATWPIEDEEVFDQESPAARSGKGLSLNVSLGGMLLLVQGAPNPEQVLRLQVPTPVPDTGTPTLAEVRWVRQVPFVHHRTLSFVGVQFLL